MHSAYTPYNFHHISHACHIFFFFFRSALSQDLICIILLLFRYRNRYDVKRHPDVISGRKSTDAILQELLDTFDVGGEVVALYCRHIYCVYACARICVCVWNRISLHYHYRLCVISETSVVRACTNELTNLLTLISEIYAKRRILYCPYRMRRCGAK